MDDSATHKTDYRSLEQDPLGAMLLSRYDALGFLYGEMPEIEGAAAAYRIGMDDCRMLAHSPDASNVEKFHELVHFAQEIRGLPQLNADLLANAYQAEELVATHGPAQAADFVGRRYYPDMASTVDAELFSEAHAQMHSAAFAMRRLDEGFRGDWVRMERSGYGALTASFNHAKGDLNRAYKESFEAWFVNRDIVLDYEQRAMDDYRAVTDIFKSLGRPVFEAFADNIRPMDDRQLAAMMDDGSAFPMDALPPMIEELKAARSLRMAFSARSDENFCQSRAKPTRFAPLLTREKLSPDLTLTLPR